MKEHTLKIEEMQEICRAMHIVPEEIQDIVVLKKGMTNRSVLFICRGKKYIMRIPGEGTGQLINRRQEAEVYRMIAERHICDDIAYINAENGYKVTEFLDGARVCNPSDEKDVRKCMNRLRQFHEMELQVGHEFDVFGQIDFYESLWKGTPSSHSDYEQTKEQVFSLRPFIEKHSGTKVLTHIDAVPDNFLFVKGDEGEEEIRLIDWEYAGMQDPHLDIAMFGIYSLYDRKQIDRLIDFYFQKGCTDEIRVKIYCYVAVGGLLWSNWSEYKKKLGVDFGEYAVRQYQFAKEFYQIVQEELS